MRWPLVWGLEVLRPWRSCVMLRSMTRLRGPVASRRYPTISRSPRFFPSLGATLYWHLTEWPALPSHPTKLLEVFPHNTHHILEECASDFFFTPGQRTFCGMPLWLGRKEASTGISPAAESRDRLIYRSWHRGSPRVAEDQLKMSAVDQSPIPDVSCTESS